MYGLVYGEIRRHVFVGDNQSHGSVFNWSRCQVGALPARIHLLPRESVPTPLWSSYAVIIYKFCYHLLLAENCQIGLPRNKIIQVAADLGHHS